MRMQQKLKRKHLVSSQRTRKRGSCKQESAGHSSCKTNEESPASEVLRIRRRKQTAAVVTKHFSLQQRLGRGRAGGGGEHQPPAPPRAGPPPLRGSRRRLGPPGSTRAPRLPSEDRLRSGRRDVGSPRPPFPPRRGYVYCVRPSTPTAAASSRAAPPPTTSGARRGQSAAPLRPRPAVSWQLCSWAAGAGGKWPRAAGSGLLAAGVAHRPPESVWEAATLLLFPASFSSCASVHPRRSSGSTSVMFYDVSRTLKYLGPYSTRNHTEYFVITYKGKEYEK
ncbi:uncharacterized protein [Globicephala melas]|uniref:uncharacterized protein n=1 Tax=Globicephala melas TaxID=9731 RepID=UPI003873C9EC